MKKVFIIEKIKEGRAFGGWFKVKGTSIKDEIIMCDSMVNGGGRAFFSGNDLSLECHVQTTKPSGKEYYKLDKTEMGYWRFSNAVAAPTPLCISVDHWLSAQFPGVYTLYLYAY
jgi:hypothetical protein